MAIDLNALKEHCNVTGTDDDNVLSRSLSGAQKHLERLLGFALDDVVEFPTGTPADVEMAVLQLAAHWYENREASLVGVSAQVLPLSVTEIVAEYRNYSYG